MDNTNQILAAFAAVLVAVASVLATLGHQTYPYLLALLSLLLVAIMVWRAARQRRTSKTGKNPSRNINALLKPDVLDLSASEATTKQVVDEQKPRVIQSDEKDLRLELQAEKERAQRLEAEKARIEQELVNTKYKTTELKPKLHEIEEQILIVIWEDRDQSPFCDDHNLQSRMVALCFDLGKTTLDRAMLDHYIRRLCQQKYIRPVNGLYRTEGYALTEEGSDYFIQNNLRDTDSYRLLKGPLPN